MNINTSDNNNGNSGTANQMPPTPTTLTTVGDVHKHVDFLDFNDFPDFSGMPTSLMANTPTGTGSTMSTMLSSFHDDTTLNLASPSAEADHHALTTMMMMQQAAAGARLQELRAMGGMIERPRSAPVGDVQARSSGASSVRSPYHRAATTATGVNATSDKQQQQQQLLAPSPMLSQASSGMSPMMSQASMSPGSPAMGMGMRLTPAQRSALADVQSAQAANVQNQLMAHGIDTAGMTMDDLRALANQMQNISSTTAAELRRHMHIQCEQKRRAQIKGGFDELKSLLPGISSKKVSKSVVLARSIEYLRQVHAEREVMMGELGRLRAENAQLKAAMK